MKVFQESEGTTSESEAWEEMFSAQYRQIRGDLAQAIEQEKAEVIREGDKIIVRLASQGSFKSGSAELQQGFLPLLEDVGSAIQNVEGLITIEGHTDNLPVGFSFGFDQTGTYRQRGRERWLITCSLNIRLLMA